MNLGELSERQGSNDGNETYELNGRSERESDAKRSKYLIFSLAEERYGIPLSSVKEVIGLTEITSVPHAPSYFKGLINLRGRIISVIDFRLKLSLPKFEYEPKKSSIVIVEFENYVIGMIVDDVNEVIGFEANQIENDLNMSGSTNQDYLIGVAKTEDKRLILLLEVSKILSTDELVSIRKIAQQKAA